MERVGHRRRFSAGDIVIEQGAAPSGIFVVLTGELTVVQSSALQEFPIVVLTERQFTGEVNVVSGRLSLVRIRATKPSELLEIPREALRHIVAEDADLSEVLLRAFILRRAGLIATEKSDLVLLGSTHSAGTLRLREFLSRNGQPHTYLDVDSDASVQALLDQFRLRVADVPVVICGNEHVHKNPTNSQVAECLGFLHDLDPATIRDVVIVGAGPAGLAAAVYGASEGLDVLVIEGQAPGGQAGSSSRIENYLGFPTGISGLELAARAYTQAEKFGAHVVVGRTVTGLVCDGQRYTMKLSDGTSVRTRTVVIASGVQYRKLGTAGLDRFEGVGVYYAATQMEAPLCRGEEVIVVGGGNSAGQAAVFLAQRASHVHVLVRGKGLADTMSRYLIARIEDDSNITLQPFQQIVAADGTDHLETAKIRDARTEAIRTMAIRHVFVMTGATPNTGWLGECVARDEKGFVRTGTDLRAVDLMRWPLVRAPHSLESSTPGVFAVGDVRTASMKRVAAAVGEGSAAIQSVHRVLAE